MKRDISKTFTQKSLSAYVLITIGLALVVEPLLPQYHFSAFWFSLGVVAIIISLRDLMHKIKT